MYPGNLTLLLLVISFSFIPSNHSSLWGGLPSSVGTFRPFAASANAIDHFTLKTVGFISGFKSYKIRLHEHPYETHILDFQGYGELPPIVLVHGLSSCAADFYPLVRSLQSESRRVICVDLPGHGLSEIDPNTNLETVERWMVEAIREAIVKLECGRCILFGNSLGTLFSSFSYRLLSGSHPG